MPNNKKMIIGIVGEMSSGKGTAAKYLEEKHGASTYRFSTIMREVLDTLYLPHTRKNMSLLSTVLRQNFSEDIFARVITKNVKNDSNNIIVVEGIRRMADIKYLVELDNFILTRIVADSKIRYKRLIKRTENAGDTKKTYEDFLNDHKLETELEIRHIMDNAVASIDNNGSLDALSEQVEKLLKKFNG